VDSVLGFDLGREVVFELLIVALLVADEVDVDGGHRVDDLVDPSGDPAGDVGVGALEDEAAAASASGVL